MNSKKKGNAGENNWANWLKDNQVCKAYRNSSSGANTAKSDVHNDMGINFEVKTVKAINLLKAYRQSARDAFMSHTKPYVVIHFDGMAKNDWLVAMNNWDWLELAKQAQNAPERPIEAKSDNGNRKLSWLIKSGVEILKKIIKELESV